MDTVEQRQQTAQRAVATLRDIFGEKKSIIVRDATIQRFEYSFEATWKYLKVKLQQHEGVLAASPKSCLRAACTQGWLSEEETEMCLRMTDDRNLTSHTYIEALAEEIYSRLPSYLRVLEKIIDLS